MSPLHRLARWVMERLDDRWFAHLVDCEDCLPIVEESPEFRARVAALVAEGLEAGGQPSRMQDASRLARELRTKATSIDGWCSSCQEIDEHRDWCPWTRLLELLEK